MKAEQTPTQNDIPDELAGGPTLSRVRRRSESHLLTLMSATAVVFVAIAIAKPRGGNAPPPGASAATPPPAAETTGPAVEDPLRPGASDTSQFWWLATADGTAQPVFVVIQPGEASTALPVVCVQDPQAPPWVAASDMPTIVGTQIDIVEPSDASYAITEPVMDLQGSTLVLLCTDADLQRLESALLSPSGTDR